MLDVIENVGKVNSADKAKSARQLIVVLNVIGFFILSRITLSLFGVWLLPTILILLLIDACVFIWYFRIFIFREDEQIINSRADESDSFSRFLYVVDESTEEVKALGSTVYVYSYSDNCLACTFRVLFGTNSAEKAVVTKEVWRRLYHLAGMYNLEVRTVVAREDFKSSEEYKAYLADVNSYSRVASANTLVEILDSVIRECDKTSNVPSVYITLKSRSVIENVDFKQAIADVLNVLVMPGSAFRSVVSLTDDSRYTYYQTFYTVDAIDLTKAKADELKTKSSGLLFSNDGDVHTVLVYKKDGSKSAVSSISSYFMLEEVVMNDRSSSNRRK